jgi:hypothetical protein
VGDVREHFSTGREREGERERESDRQTDRQTERHTNREREREREAHFGRPNFDVFPMLTARADTVAKTCLEEVLPKMKKRCQLITYFRQS